MLPILLAAGFFSDWAQAWADNIGGIVLVVIGMILIVIEMIVPGFGAAGISGGIALIAGLAIGSDSLAGAMFSLLIIVVVLAVTAVVIFRSALRGKLSRSPVVLNTAIESGSTRIAMRICSVPMKFCPVDSAMTTVFSMILRVRGVGSGTSPARPSPVPELFTIASFTAS